MPKRIVRLSREEENHKYTGGIAYERGMESASKRKTSRNKRK